MKRFLSLLWLSAFAVMAHQARAMAAPSCYLSADVAHLIGKGAHKGGTGIEGWHDVGTIVSWKFKVKKAGKVDLSVLQGAVAACRGNTYQIEIAGHILPGAVVETKAWEDFQRVVIGTVTLPAAGEYKVVFRPLKKKDQFFLNLKALVVHGDNDFSAEDISDDTEDPPKYAGPVFPIIPTQIGNFHYKSVSAITFIKEGIAGFVMDSGLTDWNGTTAPDDAIHRLSSNGIRFEWGKVGEGVVGRLVSDHPAQVTFNLKCGGWPGFGSKFTPVADGVKGENTKPQDKKFVWEVHTSPAPVSSDTHQFTVSVAPDSPVRFVAGFGELPSFDKVDAILTNAQAVYEKRRPKASGPMGDFMGAISENLNNSRIYSSDNQLVAISVSRGWSGGPNANPYFCWDSFFNGLLASIDDPEMGHQTVRAVLSCQTEEGFVPNFGHWNDPKHPESTASTDRSQLPVAAFCVWRMHLMRPDLDFLREVYPKLSKWHDWWMVARNARKDGLLEWGSSKGDFQSAQFETWDDTVAYSEAKMVGSTMNAYAIDLCSLWSMDAYYLAFIADAIGKPADAERYRREQTEMNQRINERLWNPELGIYCSRLWDGEDGKPGKFLTRLTPMNFYPMICGAPDHERAQSMLRIMTDPEQFWGEWVIPTVSRKDPVFPKQTYWHGTIWAPVNYLLFQGLKRYAPPKVQADFAEKGLKLFMNNWREKGFCGEYFFSTTGKSGGGDPHYTWGALLCLTALESVVNLSDSGKVAAGPGINQEVELNNIPWGGKLHSVKMSRPNGTGPLSQ